MQPPGGDFDTRKLAQPVKEIDLADYVETSKSKCRGRCLRCAEEDPQNYLRKRYFRTYYADNSRVYSDERIPDASNVRYGADAYIAGPSTTGEEAGPNPDPLSHEAIAEGYHYEPESNEIHDQPSTQEYDEVFEAAPGPYVPNAEPSDQEYEEEADEESNEESNEELDDESDEQSDEESDEQSDEESEDEPEDEPDRVEPHGVLGVEEYDDEPDDEPGPEETNDPTTAEPPGDQLIANVPNNRPREHVSTYYESSVRDGDSDGLTSEYGPDETGLGDVAPPVAKSETPYAETSTRHPPTEPSKSEKKRGRQKRRNKRRYYRPKPKVPPPPAVEAQPWHAPPPSTIPYWPHFR